MRFPPKAFATAALAPEVVAVVLAGLAEAGIAVQNQENAAYIAQAAWDGMTEYTHDAINNAVANIAEGIVILHMGSEIISDFISGADTVVDYGENETPITVNGDLSEWETLEIVETGGSDVVDLLPSSAIGLTTVQSTSYWPFGSGLASNVKVKLNTTNQNTYVIASSYYTKISSWHKQVRAQYFLNGVASDWVILENDDGIYRSTDHALGFHSVSLGISADGTVRFYADDMEIGSGTVAVGTVFYSAGIYSSNCTGSGQYASSVDSTVVLVPETDYTVDEDKRVAFPGTWTGTDLNVDTATGTGTGTITPPTTGVTDLTTTNTWLGNIWQILNNSLNSIKTSLLSIVASIAALTAAPTVGIDWTPIKTIGTGFSTLFPFSLPWDLSRILTSFNASEWNGQITIAAHSVLANFDFIISFAWFDNIRGIVKGLEVVAFDLGLIMITRKLLGGAS
jgi:hypothetical protein